MHPGDNRQPLTAGQQAARDGKVDHRKDIEGHHQHDPDAAKKQIVKIPAGQLLEIAMTLQHQHPRQCGNIGRRQKRDQKKQIPQPRQRDSKQSPQDAQR